jgi:hypothetical protein
VRKRFSISKNDRNESRDQNKGERAGEEQKLSGIEGNKHMNKIHFSPH